MTSPETDPSPIPQPPLKYAGAYIDGATHRALKALAKSQHRTLADQCRHIFQRALEGSLTPENQHPKNQTPNSK